MICIAVLGVFKRLQELGLVSEIKEISCSSGGSIFGPCYIYYKGDIEKMRKECDFENKYMTKSFTNLVRKWGLIKSKTVKYNITSVIGSMTFKELYKHNPIKLHVAVANLKTGKTDYLSVDTAPDMEVAEAVKISCSVPLLFTYTPGYSDGSLFECAPYGPFLDKTDVLEITKPYEDEYIEPTTFSSYMYTLFCSFLKNRIKHEFPRVVIETNENTFDFQMKSDARYRLFQDGYDSAVRSPCLSSFIASR